LRLGQCLAKGGEVEAALAHVREANRLRPNWPEAMGELAELLASGPDAKQRDGAAAETLARRALAAVGSQEVTALAALAAAQAEAGKFAEATATQQKAVAAAESSGDAARAAGMRERLKAYGEGRVYRAAGATTQPRAQ
jgi:cytochrome c-type biogenesis protein CcmH/NrfG